MKHETLTRAELFNVAVGAKFKPLVTNPETFVGSNAGFIFKITDGVLEYTSSNGHIWGCVKFSKTALQTILGDA